MLFSLTVFSAVILSTFTAVLATPQAPEPQMPIPESDAIPDQCQTRCATAKKNYSNCKTDDYGCKCDTSRQEIMECNTCCQNSALTDQYKQVCRAAGRPFDPVIPEPASPAPSASSPSSGSANGVTPSGKAISNAGVDKDKNSASLIHPLCNPMVFAAVTCVAIIWQGINF